MVSNILYKIISSLTISLGTNGVLSAEIMGSFFRNQTFPKNWHRRPNAGGFEIVGDFIRTIQSFHLEVVPGANNEQGVYVEDDITEVSSTSFIQRLPFLIRILSLAHFMTTLLLTTSRPYY